VVYILGRDARSDSKGVMGPPGPPGKPGTSGKPGTLVSLDRSDQKVLYTSKEAEAQCRFSKCLSKISTEPFDYRAVFSYILN